MNLALYADQAAGHPAKKAETSSEQQRWSQVYTCAKALSIVQHCQRQKKLTLVVAADMRLAQTLQKELHFFAGSETPVFLFPDWNLLPYDPLSPPVDVVADRMAAMHKLSTTRYGICVTTVNALMQRQVTAERLKQCCLTLKKGERLDLQALRRRLTAMVYENVPQVESVGQFAVRGSLLDLWSPGRETPIRVDFFDDEIDSLRCFDAVSQTSISNLETITVLPTREFVINPSVIESFRQGFRLQLSSAADEVPVYQKISSGIIAEGIEYYLPLLLNDMENLIDHLPASVPLFYDGGLPERLDKQWGEIKARYIQAREQNDWPPLPPERHYFKPADVLQHMRSCSRIELNTFAAAEQPHQHKLGSRRLPALAVQPDMRKPLVKLERFMDRFRGRVLFVAETPGYREQILELLKQSKIQVKIVVSWSDFLASSEPHCLCVGHINEGVILKNPPLAIITDSQLLGQKIKQKKTRLRTQDAKYLIQNPRELQPGCPVVHEEYGVGRFLGLQIDAELTGHPSEFLVLEYHGGDKIYVPVSALQLIRRYSDGSEDNPPLNKLASKDWQRAKKKAAQKAYDVAAELLDTEARRSACKGTPLRAGKADYSLFSNQFAYQETADQAQAIMDVAHDLHKTKPMDRIVCGDVGFGKTEVAMRAAFIAALSGKQTAVLAPTTLLVNQHFQTFSSRFANWPVKIACLSRFRSPGAQKRVAEELLDGSLDVVIGTHKLLSKNVRFKRLGLIIIDEEQRFGVRHKERLRAMQADCHTLTLTATPIPRTLNMSLSGLRELSIITTPPARRCAIQSFISEWKDSLISDACEREIRRGGQIYFIHNKIEGMEEIADRLRALLPRADIRIAHGRMQKDKLEKTTLDFYRQRFSVLVCTTIIENGIDVPSANTIIVNQADHMGLSQLHQLRGRVGRSHHKAYAYFLLSCPRGLLAEDALKRLEAVESLSDLGVGFSIAAQDLEIRGAGELLGKEQSGHIHAIGFSLYNDLLKRAVRTLKSGCVPDLDQPLNVAGNVDLGMPALIPESYVPDTNLRLVLYRRIASMENTDVLDALKAEIIDRFGLLPDYTKNLFACTALKLCAQPLGIRRIDVHDGHGSITFYPWAKINTQALLSMIKQDAQRYRFSNTHRLSFKHDWHEFDERRQALKSMIETIREKT